MKKYVVRPILLATFLIIMLLCGSATALTLSDTATGSQTLPIVTFPNTITNGDFVITGTAQAPRVGDGCDEGTTWTFDFTADSHYAAFSAMPTLASALLTLTLKSARQDSVTDVIRIRGLSWIVTPEIQIIPVGVITTMTLDLLDFYHAEDILRMFTNQRGKLAMEYQDDAFVSYARLDLANVAVPEPATLVLLFTGLAMFGYKKRNFYN